MALGPSPVKTQCLEGDRYGAFPTFGSQRVLKRQDSPRGSQSAPTTNKPSTSSSITPRSTSLMSIHRSDCSEWYADETIDAAMRKIGAMSPWFHGTMAAALREIQENGATAVKLRGARACSGGRGGWRGRGRLGPRPRPAVQARPMRKRDRERALARASAWNRVALTWARGRGCAAPPQQKISAMATTARQLWRPRSRRTRRSRRSTSKVRERARVAAGDGGVGDAWDNGRGPPRKGERAFARSSRASGCARPASSVGPRAFSCERHLRVLRLGIVR